MPEPLIVTAASKRIADAIAAEMKKKRVSPTKLERALTDKLADYTIRRIRKGSSGCTLRSYEQLLEALGLTLAVIPMEHPDVTDAIEKKDDVLVSDFGKYTVKRVDDPKHRCTLCEYENCAIGGVECSKCPYGIPRGCYFLKIKP